MKQDISFTSLKKQEKQARRDIIISAAERVFSSKPFIEVTIRDIAKEAGISHASIYRYFPDQQTLFVEAFPCLLCCNERSTYNIQKLSGKK